MSSKNVVFSTGGLEHSESEPALDKLTKSNISLRKRKNDGDDNSQSRNILAELRIMFTAFSKEQDEKLSTLHETVTNIQEQNKQIIQSIEFVSKKYDDLNDKLNHLEEDRKANSAYLKALEDRIDILERNQRLTCIEIRNIPKATRFESKEELSNMLLTAGKVLNVSISPSDIVDIYRVGTKSEDNKPIIVKLHSTIVKNNIISSLKRYNRSHDRNKLNTKHLNLDGDCKPIYISDYLTHKARSLFYRAREFAKLNGYLYCWITNNNIYLRKKEGMPQISIKNDESLIKLKEQI